MREWNTGRATLQLISWNGWWGFIHQARMRISPTPFRSLWKGTDVLMMSGATVALAILGLRAIATVVQYAYDRGVPAQSAATLSSILVAGLELVAILLCVYILGVRRRRLTWADIGLHPTTRTWFRIGAMLACVPFFLSDYVAIAVSRTLGQLPANPQTSSFLPAGGNWVTAMMMLALTGLAIPVAEEVLFRGVLYNWLRGHLGVLSSVLVSSLVFGAVHGDVAVGAGAFALGVIFALVYEGSRSLYPGIFLHAFNNTLKLALMYGLLTGLKM